MKYIVIIVLVSVMVGTLAGYVTGAQVTRDPAVVFDAFLEHIEFTGGNAGKRQSLEFMCNGHRFASYNVDTGQVIASGISDAELAKSQPAKIEQSLYDRAVGALLGSVATGAVAFRQPLTKAAKSKEFIKYTVPAFLAGPTGFALGYDLATSGSLTCADRQVIEHTKKEASWKSAAQLIVQRQLLSDSVGAPEQKNKYQPSGASERKQDTKERSSTKADDNDPTQEELMASVEEDDGRLEAEIGNDLSKGQVSSVTFQKLKALGKGDMPKLPTESSFGWKLLSVYIPVILGIGAAILTGYMLLRHGRRRRRASKTPLEN